MDKARRVTLEIEVGSDPISGRIEDDAGVHPFLGWLQLARAIEAASAPHAATEDADGRPGHEPAAPSS